MTKLEQAARALLVHWDTPAWKYLKPTGDLMAALREALDHSGEVNEMVGCAYCNNPLFAGTKCNNCGRITLAEQAEQEPVAWHEPNAYGNVTTHRDWANVNGWLPIYAAPIRTKDLTDDEIDALPEFKYKPAYDAMSSKEWFRHIARAGIAADRRKNK